MDKKLTIQKLLEPRPDDIPADALIFNAPRPLCGHTHWDGEFRHGIFYVAIFPSDQYAEGFIRETVGLDGWLCEYISEDEIRPYAEEKARENDLKVEDCDWVDWVDTYMYEHSRREINFEEWLRRLKREVTINAILAAARRPLPKIREIRELECTDGKWRSPFGVPHGVGTTGQRRVAGYAFVDKNGITYGKREATREALIERHNKVQDEEMAQFRAQLEQSDDARLQAKAEYWLKRGETI